MNKLTMHGWVLGIPALILVLILIILWREPAGDGVSRATAGRAVTLVLCSEDEFAEWRSSSYTSSFSVKEQEQWYVAYMDYLYEKGYLDETVILAEEAEMIKPITYGELNSLLGEISGSLGNYIKVSKKNQNKPYPKEQFGELFEAIAEELDEEEQIQKCNLMLYGTPLNVEGSKPWKAYTDQGDYRFDGLALDSFIDQEIEVFVKGGDILWMNRMVSDYVVYHNVWIMEGTEDDLLIYLGSIKREIPYKSLSGKEKLYNQVGDLSLKAGKLEKITIKKDRITARVLSVHDTYLELEGYGVLELDPGFRILKTYGKFEEQTLKDILVGYDMQEFVIAEGKICMALTVREFDAARIRVLITPPDGKDENGDRILSHPSVQLLCESTMTLTVGTESRTIPAGEMVEITKESSDLATERMIFTSDGGDGIQILSADRDRGKPVCEGQIELVKVEHGVVIVNDLYLEDYLKYVIPSEMPASYEKEALKAQAVCARTYAYIQIQGNNYQDFGAHVDDTDTYQVYNNYASDPRTDAAVQETYGELLMHQGNPVAAYYFSTSCGTTTDGTIWAEKSPTYLKGVCLQGSRQTLDLSNNDAFSSFIKDKQYPSYDSGYELYRWSKVISSSQLRENVPGIGQIQSVRVVERGIGGVVKVLEINGSEGTEKIKGEYKVRRVLTDPNTPIVKRNGEEATWSGNLPSAFITIEAGAGDESGERLFYITGGGYGHGVGMSQNGAQGMAKQGKNYREILQFFYEDVEIGDRK